jgi:hypothetical protein
VNKRSSVAAFGISALALSAVAAVGIGPAQAAGDGHSHSHDNRTVSLKANLRELNDSGASGKAHVLVRGEEILKVSVRAQGLSPDAPHAQHIHYGEQALNECPTLAQDTNDDGRLTTVEGVPAYGPVVVSLTTNGDTSPASVLAVDRYPVSEDGRLDYLRRNIPFTDVAGTGYEGGGGTAEEIAEAVRNGEGVVVIHGVDYDGNGTYSFSEEGASELNPALPAEATDPALCGVLR